MPADLLALALNACDDATALPVLGDLVLELGWFDPRVMQTMWPIGKAPRDGWRTKKKRDRAKVDKVAWKDGYPVMFQGFAAKPTAGWARAIAGVLLFGGWRQRRWPAAQRQIDEVSRAWRDQDRADSYQASQDAYHPGLDR